MKIATKLVTGTALLTVLAACEPNLSNNSSSPSDDMGSSWSSEQASQVGESLANSADRAAGAAEVLAQIEAARTAPEEAPVDAEEMSQMPSELMRPTTVEWMGPALDLLHELSNNIGYDFAVIGTLPPVDIMASISAVDWPAVKVFENIGYQISEFGTVYVDPNTKRVEVRFKSNEVAASADVPSVKKAVRTAPSSTTGTSKDRLGK